MKIIINNKNISLTPAMKQHIDTQFNKLLKYSIVNEESSVHLTIELLKENLIHVKGVLERTNFHQPISADLSHEDFYKTIDLLVYRFDEQILKIKSKLIDHHHNKKPLKVIFETEDSEENEEN